MTISGSEILSSLIFLISHPLNSFLLYFKFRFHFKKNLFTDFLALKEFFLGSKIFNNDEF